MPKKPVITAKQQSKCLATKKKKKKPKKVTLLTPYNAYRPRISKASNKEIMKLVAQLPRLIAVKRTVPWKLIKDVPRSERKAIRGAHQERLPANADLRKHIVLGVNRVTRALEEKQLQAVLITACVNPLFLVDHVLEMCVLQFIPVLIVEGLRDGLHASLGVRSTCLGISTECGNDKLIEIVSRTKSLWWQNKPSRKQAFLTEGYLHNDDVKIVSIAPTKATTTQKSCSNDDNLNEVRHLTRIDSKQRVFKPVGRKAQSDSNFISFVSEKRKTKKSPFYNAAQIAKLQERKDRTTTRKEKPKKKSWLRPKV